MAARRSLLTPHVPLLALLAVHLALPPRSYGCPPFVTGPGLDGDADGVADLADNCPITSNPDQADSDRDGVGDACEDANDLPSLAPPPIPTRRAPPSEPSALPPGATATFPGTDGDTFFVVLQPGEQSGPLPASAVFESVVRPVLDAVGFRRPSEIHVPSGNGMDQPRADLRSLIDSLLVGSGIPDEEIEHFRDQIEGRADDQMLRDGEGMTAFRRCTFFRRPGRSPAAHPAAVRRRRSSTWASWSRAGKERRPRR